MGMQIRADAIIHIDLEAYRDIRSIVEVCGEEVGWYGLVDREGLNFYIRSVHLIKQQVSSTTCELDEDGQVEFIMSLSDEDKNRVRFWGHSHVNMGVFASGQDEKQMDDFKDCEYFLRGIFNKKGDAKFSIYLNDLGLIIDDVPWTIDFTIEEERKERWREEVKEKVSEIVYQSAYGGYGRYRYGRGGPDGRYGSYAGFGSPSAGFQKSLEVSGRGNGMGVDDEDYYSQFYPNGHRDVTTLPSMDDMTESELEEMGIKFSGLNTSEDFLDDDAMLTHDELGNIIELPEDETSSTDKKTKKRRSHGRRGTRKSKAQDKKSTD